MLATIGEGRMRSDVKINSAANDGVQNNVVVDDLASYDAASSSNCETAPTRFHELYPSR